MEFGINDGCGIPFYLNGELIGWICRSVDDIYLIGLCGLSVYDYFREYRFESVHSAKIELMSWFGE